MKVELLEIASDIIKTWEDCNADGTLPRTMQEHVATQALRLAQLVMDKEGRS